MSDEVLSLIEDAQEDSGLRLKLSQDRSAEELSASANQKGYSISTKDARKILAGAYLTSESVSEQDKQSLVGGLNWNYLRKVEKRLDGDFRFLETVEAWNRTEGFYEYVYQKD